MNVPLSSINPHLLVQIPSVNSAILHASNPTDVHICGTCKQNFYDINYFVEHKLTCSASMMVQKSLFHPASFLNQNTISYVATTTNTNANNEEVVPILSPLFQVVVNGRDLKQQIPNAPNNKIEIKTKNHSSREETSSLKVATSPISNDQNFTNETSLSTSEEKSISEINNHSKRDFQIDEEDVATLLANQLANEVCSFTPTSLATGAEALLRLSNLATEIDLNTSKESIVSSDINLEPSSLINNNSSTLESKKETVIKAVESSDKPLPSQNTTNKSNISRSNRKLQKCTYEKCSFSTKYSKDLLRHMRRHTGERPYKCNECDKSFSRVDKLQQHMKTHLIEKPHKCQICPYATTDAGALRKHIRTHTGERPFKCQMCSYRAIDSSKLTVHLRTHTGDNPFVCPFCTSAFKTNSDLTRHKRIHTGEKPFHCPHCNFKCSIKSNLTVHIKYIHFDKNFSCKSCDIVFNSIKEAEDHEEEHTGELLTCSSCEFSTSSQTRMNIHTQLHIEKDFYCLICNFNFKKYSCLKSHIRTKHPELMKRKTKSSSLPKKSPSKIKTTAAKQFKCILCDTAFVREDSLRSHIRQHYKTQTTTTITCEEETSNQNETEPCISTVPETSVYVYLPPKEHPSNHQEQISRSNSQVASSRYDILVTRQNSQHFITPEQLGLTFVDNFTDHITNETELSTTNLKHFPH